MKNGSYFNGLSDLLDQDLSSYEYFHSLPKNIQAEIEKYDLSSIEEMQHYVAAQKNK